MPNITADLACIGQNLEKVRDLLQENPNEAQCLLNECPEMFDRIQEIVMLLRELEIEIAQIETDREGVTQ